MISDEFKKAYKNLNPEQKKAVDTIEGPVMVIAGPGTGKTQILTLRIANILLKTQVNPENILALTFSEAASFEMRSRLVKIIGTPAFRVEISTFHSFANDIIKSYPDEFPELLSSENITEVDQIELIESLINSLNLSLLRPFGDPLYYLRDILGVINDLKKEGVSVEKLREALNNQEQDFKDTADLYHEKGTYKGQMKGRYQELEKEIAKSREFLAVFDAYQTALRELKKYDFNDMLLEVIKALEKNKSLLLRLQEKYQYILVDEHQDTNAAQNRLTELIVGFYKNPNLFVVGDEKQAIYRFQGASLENFLYFKNLYPKVKLVNLQKNYRSHQLILDASHSLIQRNVSANILKQKRLESDNKSKKKIALAALSDFNLEYEYVASDIAQKINKGTNPAEIAVLARRNIDLIPLTKSLSRRGIEFSIQADLDILADLEIQKLVMLFEAIAHPFDEAYFIRALHIDFLDKDVFDVYKLLDYAKKQGLGIFPLFKQIDLKLIEELNLKNPQPIINFNASYLDWIKADGNIPFDDLFIRVINESGLREYFLKTPKRYQTLNKLTSLFDEIKLRLYKNPQFNLADFLQLLQTVKRYQITLKSKTDNSIEEGVRLFTVHKSKGLEFDWVYIINCFEGRWGSARKRGTKIKVPWLYLGQAIKTKVDFEEIEDERRLFYVGMTRARKGITLTYSKTGIDGKEQLPSPFLQEIDSGFINETRVADFETKLDKASLFEIPIMKTIDSQNKLYLQSLFLEKGLSATGLNNFLKCPWRYFYRNLIALPDVKNKAMVFGTVVHSALDSFIKSGRKQWNEQNLISLFAEALKKEALTKKDRDELLDKGTAALKLFYREVVGGWSQDIQSELNIRGIRFADNIILNGKIDLIEQLSLDGSVRVHDFKTGKPKPRAQIDGTKNEADYNYLRQLIFYKILLDRYKDGLFKMKEGVIDFVEPDTKGKLHSEIFNISTEAVKKLEEQIKLVANQIINLEFWDSHCSDKACEYCHLRDLTMG